MQLLQIGKAGNIMSSQKRAPNKQTAIQDLQFIHLEHQLKDKEGKKDQKPFQILFPAPTIRADCMQHMNAAFINIDSIKLF